MQGSAALPLLDGQRPASHLRHHLISFIVDIFDTAVQISRPKAQHGVVTWRHAIGARADIVLLAHRFAFEAIGGCAKQKVTCTCSNAASMPLLESPPLHRSRHSVWWCLFLSGAAAANATSRNSVLNLAFPAHDLYTSRTRKIEEKSSAKKARKSETPVPCDSNRKPPTFRSDCVKHCMFAHGDHLQRCFFAPNLTTEKRHECPPRQHGGTMGAGGSQVPQLEVRNGVFCFCKARAS